MAHDDTRHHTDTQRLEAFSDGVFAIAITLLVLEIGVPHLEGGEGLGSALRGLWPSYFGYAVSFITVGIMWANHHHMFRDIERVDHTLLVLNLLLLLCISFVPFPTAVIAEYLDQPAHRSEATLLYGIALTLTAVFFNALWLYASRQGRLIDEHVTAARVRSRTLRYLPGPVLYGATIPLAFVSPWAAMGLVAGLATVYLLPLAE
jgi:uncharacterized membrane protein